MAQSTSQTFEPREYVVGSWLFQARTARVFLRVILRSLAFTLWTLGCYVGMRAIYLATVGNPQRRKRWVATMRGLYGAGKIPMHPFFLGVNHHTWVEYFGINVILNARLVVMAEDAPFPSRDC